MLKFLVGGGGIYSTVEDLAKWDAALYTDKLVKSACLQEAFTPGQLNDGSRLLYGYGWEEHSSNDIKALLHAGGWRGFKSFIVRVPRERFTIIALANHSWFDIRGRSPDITRPYLGKPLPILQWN